MMTINYEETSIVLNRADGKEARFPLKQAGMLESIPFSSIHYCPPLNGLLLRTKAGDDIALELPHPTISDQLAGRLVVYLDQNQWSVLDRALRGDGDIHDKTRAAAEKIADFVALRKIVLPASAGHYTETTQWSELDRRYQVGVRILQLSRGWQMRDPLQVRRDEIRANFSMLHDGNAKPQARSVFTLAPNVLFGPPLDEHSYKPSSDLPPEAAFYVTALTSFSAQAATLLDSEIVKPPKAQRWADINQQLSDFLDSHCKSREQKRKVLDGALLADLKQDIVEEARNARISSEELQDWVQRRSAVDLSRLPMLGIYKEMLFDRHANKGTQWQASDLIDITYLSCASGYADFVVTERHMAGILKQGVKRLGRKVKIFRRLPDAVLAIESALQSRAQASE